MPVMPFALLLLAADPEAARPLAPTPAVASLAHDIMVQIKPCWAPPKLPFTVTTTLHVRYNPDGSLGSLPELVDQTPLPEAYRAQADELVMAAKRAVVRCAPLHLHANLYQGGWNDVDLRLATGKGDKP